MTHEERDALLLRLDERQLDIIKLVKGNGQPGLVQRVSALENWRSMLVGAWVLLGAAVTVYAALKH